MTKKSANRLARDAAKKELANNTCWDDLKETYLSMVQLISQHANISQLAARKDLIELIEDKETLTMNIKSLARDLTAMSTELAGIYALHSDKTGGSEDPDIVFSTINIYEHYRLFMEKHDSVVMPTVLYILEQFQQAEKKQYENQKQANLTNPDVVSDADVVYTPKEVVDALNDPASKPVIDYDALEKSYSDICKIPVVTPIKE